MIIINKRYLYKKCFKQTLQGILLLMNPELLQEYNQEKAQLLYENHRNDSEQAKIKKEIITEFEEIYQFDLLNADLPEIIGVFDSEEEKEKIKKAKLFEFDFYMIIGNIFAGYLEILIKNKKKPYDIDMPINIVNYKEIYDLSIKDLFLTIFNEIQMDIYRGTRYEFVLNQDMDYVEKFDNFGKPLQVKRVSNNNVLPRYCSHAYLASYAFPTLIEYFLGIHLRSKLLYESIEKLRILKENKSVHLSDIEEHLYQIFSVKGSKILSGNEKDTMKKLYNMFVKYSVLDEKSDYEMILVGEAKDRNKKINRTIGGIINSKYANSVIVPEYMKLFKWLFNVEYLNIRNNIMHGNNANIDYFAICFPCIMLILIWDIGKNKIFV